MKQNTIAITFYPTCMGEKLKAFRHIPLFTEIQTLPSGRGLSFLFVKNNKENIFYSYTHFFHIRTWQTFFVVISTCSFFIGVNRCGSAAEHAHVVLHYITVGFQLFNLSVFSYYVIKIYIF